MLKRYCASKKQSSANNQDIALIRFTDKLPEALVTKCRKCTAKQRYMFEQIVTYYTEKEPEKWQAIIVRSIEKYQKKKL